jgi:arsenate reductase (thioredoxin)
MSTKNVLILCTGNSCRSQMAEGLINHYLAGQWQAFSAGTRPAGYVHPLAIRAMGELGIDISANLSQHTDEFRAMPLHVVITVCDSAAEDCPVWLGNGGKHHISFPDPAHAPGNEEEQMIVFRQVRDDIKEQLIGFLEQWEG